MMITSLSLRDLEYVVALGETRHFGKAAVRCHVSQPALSSQIRKVEELLGVRLFERTNRKVSVTDAGVPVLRQCKRVLEEAELLARVARPDAGVLTGRLRLGAIATLGPYYLPHLLGPLRKKYPRLELRLREGLTEELVSELRNGDLDAILASPTFSTEGLKVFSLYFEPFVLAVPKGHPLSRKKPLRAADLRASEMVLLEDGHCLKDQVLETCPPARRGGAQPERFHATSLETLRHLVATGAGYTLIPRLAVGKPEPLRDLVEYREIEGGDVGRRVVLVCRESYPRMEDIEELARVIRERLPRELSAWR